MTSQRPNLSTGHPMHTTVQPLHVFSPADRAFAAAISRLVYVNPFLPERIAAERQALADRFVEPQSDWNMHVESLGQHENIARLTHLAYEAAQSARQRLLDGARATEPDLRLYEDLVIFALYHRHYQALMRLVDSPAGRVEPWKPFAAEAAHFLHLPDVTLPGRESLEHLFACFFQIVRAFRHIFHHIAGGSPAACRLRAAAWQSIFTHDLHRYRRSLYQRMGDITTLITGPSGTGKELVARAIGLSRYIGFDPRTQTFRDDFAGSFHALCLSALSPTLIESELFGHRRGAFTGALDDRAGWLEVCPASGAVFLDEVGEIDSSIQVKLLRVLQTRTFHRLGDTTSRPFLGKIIAATNRDLAREMRAGRFREDFYYRLCSDLITTPSLHELLNGSAEELGATLLFIANRIAPDEAEALTRETQRWINDHLPPDYPWPGNFRELEQCVRNVLIRGDYQPAARLQTDDLAREMEAGALTADQLLQRYCAILYTKTGSYEATARKLGLDRRTVKAKLEATDAEGSNA